MCGTCFYRATRTRGTCPTCGEDRLLPGPPTDGGAPTCGPCAGIAQDFHCTRCGHEGEFYRRGGLCARCALREDLTAELVTPAAEPDLMRRLVDALCASERPESIFTWKRSTKVHALLRSLATGQTPMTHEGLDTQGHGHHVEHLRALLVHHRLLPHRDPYLARFETWIRDKLAPLPRHVAQPVEQFATWHHLNRIRDKAAAGAATRGPVHAAKQQITETIKFLTWLDTTHQRTAATCTQQDVDAYLAPGPTTRHLIRTFFVFAKKTRINTRIEIGHRKARTSPSLTQDQRLAWLAELLTGTSESLPYRAAGILLLLYAQPLVRVAALRASDLSARDNQLYVALGKHATPVPAPFADLLRDHLNNRPNLNTAAGPDSPWLFPSTRAGGHLHPDTLMHRLRDLGVNLLGARNRALADLVTEVPPPVVADALGYSHQVAFKHAQEAAESWARYAGRRAPSYEPQ
ncbi:recombinase XerD [Georgenia ruanii]|uniref:Recombinase XerD n=1 Tax=Georgenia ruanii TaxID=348442 RepID=A0A7J9UUV1_9MICO|nr:recombinase XerD [Georgenia ruanii]